MVLAAGRQSGRSNGRKRFDGHFGASRRKTGRKPLIGHLTASRKFGPKRTARRDEKRVQMAPDADRGSNLTLTDREYLGSLPPLHLMEFRNYVYSSAYITRNAANFLDYEWVDMGLLRQCIQETAPNFWARRVNDARNEVTLPRRSADIKMRALNEGGREVFELISDSEPEADESDSDVEVVEALRHTSWSSSTIPSSDADDFYGTNSECEASKQVSPSDVEAKDEDDSDLTESDMVWMDDGKSFREIPSHPEGDRPPYGIS
ncbi:hypothetical protein B0H13DRAFT_1863645 [Mycena leptocephala]|nr:hypothetical protein B0H13DRAFT_1863645 [Mycena leptocephala]